MKTRPMLFVIAATVFVTAIDPALAMPAHDMPGMAAASPDATAAPAPKLKAAMRELWHGHIQHAREYALAVHAHDSAKAKAAADAVVTNARQIADAVAGFYGKPAGEQMMKLLAGHWDGVKALTDASAANDTAAASKATADLNANAAAIAKFLSGANPNLPESAVLSLMTGHVAHHTADLGKIMSGDTQGEAATWAAMQEHMNTLADALTGGIAKQFPDKAS